MALAPSAAAAAMPINLLGITLEQQRTTGYMRVHHHHQNKSALLLFLYYIVRIPIFAADESNLYVMRR